MIFLVIAAHPQRGSLRKNIMMLGDSASTAIDKRLPILTEPLDQREPLQACGEPQPGFDEFWVKSSPEYDGKLGERTAWEFACSEVR